MRKPSEFISCRGKETWIYLKKDLEVISEHWSYRAFQLFLPFLQGSTKPCSALLPAACSQLPWSAFLLPNPEGAEAKGKAHAENPSVLAELLKHLWGRLAAALSHSVLGGAGVDPEHSFSKDWPCSLSFVWFLPSAADEPAKEESHYEKDGCNAIKQGGAIGWKAFTVVLWLQL